MENSRNTGKIIISLVLGALAGAALGVLFAPQKGSKTRKKIADETKNFTEEIKKKVKRQTKNFKKKVKNEAAELQNKAAQLEDYVEDKVAKGVASLKDKANALLHMNSDHTVK
jgi:gas vesicle protein